MKRINWIIVFGVCSFALFVLLQAPALCSWISEDVTTFRKNNPDGGKYEFVKTYLTVLGYLKQNDDRDSKTMALSADNFAKAEILKQLIKNLAAENVNLRVGRNMVKKYYYSRNNLIRKASDLFILTCDEQISLNGEEQELLENLYNAQAGKNAGRFAMDDFFKSYNALAARKKRSLSKMLEASSLVQKILVSDRLDKYGELTFLGVTQLQRDDLLSMLKKFKGEKYEGEVREGQSFLEASVATIREVLEDRMWESLDS